MKKRNLKKIALAGLASGICMINSANAGYIYADMNNNSMNQQAPMTSQQLRSQLNPAAQKLYDTMSSEGKALALKLANQSCKGQNSCKGLNSCKTDHNSCAGQGGCKGTSQGPFQDKSMAVKIVAKHMAEKRNGALQQ